MNQRRAISRDYKERMLLGGVYTITNTVHGRYLLDHTADLASVRNRFQFAVATNSAFHPRLHADWAELGAAAFALDVREELEQQRDQTRAAFLEDLRTLEALWRAQLDPSQAY